MLENRNSQQLFLELPISPKSVKLFMEYTETLVYGQMQTKFYNASKRLK